MTVRLPNEALLFPMLKHFEGLHDGDPRTSILEPKRDPIGLWTTGWGHLVSRDPKAPRPASITMEQAEVDLRADVLKHASGVCTVIDEWNLNDEQYAAVVDFAYNLGIGNFAKSTLAQLINLKELDRCGPEFDKWAGVTAYHKDGTKTRKKLPGLVRRRACERALFEGRDHKEFMK